MEQQFRSVAWANSTNIYEVNLRQYTVEGTFAAFGRELPRLADMGVETLWFMPITPISLEKRLGTLGSYYAAADYTATNPEYGTVADFRELVLKAHALGMKVIIDWVANHTGWDHRWTKEHPAFYRRNLAGEFFDQHGWNDVIDLNYDVPELPAAMIDCMRFWIAECDIDGFRCDMAMLVPLDFWRRARRELDSIKPLFWLAECEETDYHEVFDASYTWKWLHKMEDCWKGVTEVAGLEEVLQYYATMFPTTALRAFFTTNHDENSHSGSEYERMGEAAMAFAVFCCTWGGVPLIYSGQEMPNRRRLKFFDKDPIEWTGRYELHDFYKRLLGLRKEHPALRGGDAHTAAVRLQTDADRFVLAFLRKQGQEEVLVVLNLSPHDKPLVQIPDPQLKGRFYNLFSRVERAFDTEKYFALRPWEWQVYVRKL